MTTYDVLQLILKFQYLFSSEIRIIHLLTLFFLADRTRVYMDDLIQSSESSSKSHHSLDIKSSTWHLLANDFISRRSLAAAQKHI